MTRPRIFVPVDMQTGRQYVLTEADRRYLGSVLRLTEGTSLLVFNGSGQEGEAVIDQLSDHKVRVKIMDAWPVAPDALSIVLAQSLPKAGKMETIVQKAAELGVHQIVPFISHRSVPRLSSEKAAEKQRRWQKIAMEAARQCRQAYVPEVNPVLPFAEVLNRAPKEAMRVIFWEEETDLDIKKFLRQEPASQGSVCWIVVGPEGGFSSEEVKLAASAGFTSVSLGRHVLRVETASPIAVALVQYGWGCFFDLTAGGPS